MDYKEFIKMYGQKKVKFYAYYKFTFHFKDDEISVAVGGNSEDIYRFKLDADKEYTISELEPFAASNDQDNIGYWYE